MYATLNCTDNQPIKYSMQHNAQIMTYECVPHINYAHKLCVIVVTAAIFVAFAVFFSAMLLKSAG